MAPPEESPLVGSVAWPQQLELWHGLERRHGQLLRGVHFVNLVEGCARHVQAVELDAPPAKQVLVPL